MSYGSVNVPGALSAKDVGAAPVRYDYSGCGKITDLLAVDLQNPGADMNQTKQFEGKRSEFTHVPPGLGSHGGDEIAGLREVHYVDQNLVMVKVTELYPKVGRVYCNIHNGTDWVGWYNLDTTAVPSDRTVNGKSLAENISLGVADVGGSNPNLLDNWYFADPINQRGQTEYAGAWFSIDRWQSMWGGGDNRVSISEPGTKNGCLKLYRPANNAHLNQTLSGYVELLRGKTVTFSILAKTDLADEGGARLYIRTPDKILTNPWTYLSTDTYSIAQATVTIPEESTSNDLMVDVTQGDGSTLSIIAAKLELGTAQTLAHKEGNTWVLNDPPPNKELELMKCQRYYQTAGVGLMPIVHSENQIIYTFPFPVPMRTTPTASLLASDIHVYDQQGTDELTFSGANVTINQCTENGVQTIVVNGTWNKDAPAAGTVLRHNIPDDIFAFNAEP